MLTGFYVRSGILDPKHRDQIGIAIWEFLWCIDRTTKEYVDEDGVTVGIVLGGKPIQAEELQEALGTHPETIKKNLRRLAEKGYLRLKRTPYGNIIEVAKSGKWKPKEKTHPPQEPIQPTPIQPTQKPQNFIQAYNKEFARLMTSTQIETVKAFIDSGMAEELVLEAIKRTSKAGAGFKYLEAILIDWDKNGIKTMEQLEVADLRHEQGKRSKQLRSKSRGDPAKTPRAFASIQNWGSGGG